jgi:aryl-alcohol dehydrogenase-like predicted oxidoreductase
LDAGQGDPAATHLGTSLTGDTAMEQVPLGSSGLMVSRLGHGCMSLSHLPRDDNRAVTVLRQSLDLGITLFDTADRYGNGHNERLLGRAFAGRTDEIVLATKFGFVGDPSDPEGVDGRPDSVRAACEASLRRLGVDVIDLYYLHRVDARVPIEETVGAMADLVSAGKVRALGVSEAAPATIRRAHAVHPIAALQTELSLWSRHAEGGPLNVCRALGITFVAYSPLGIGFLTGSIACRGDVPSGSRLAHSERLAPGNIEANTILLNRLRLLAAELGCRPGQLALAWVLARGHDVVPIPGTRRISHLQENVAAIHASLDAAHLRALDAAFPPDAPAGDRKSAAGLAIVNR